jgi:iron complex outermembrane receptor protein
MLESRPLALTVLWALALVAQAGYVTATDLSDLSLEQLLEVKVVSASKFEQRGRDAPSAVQVISHEEIRRHGWRTLTEALNTLPGIYASTDKGYDFQGARGFQITGDYNTRFLLLVDGQRNNDNIYQSAMTGTEGWLDMSAVERIEYIPGPGSALYGSNAMFGVINIITRQGEAPEMAEVALRLSGLYGNGVNVVSSQTIKGTEQDTRLFLQYSADNKLGRDLAYSDPLGQLVLASGSVSSDGVARGLDSGHNQHLMARLDRGELSVRLISHERTTHPSSANYYAVFDDPAMTLIDGGTQISASLDHAFNDDSRLYVRLGYSDFLYRGVYPYLDAGIGYYHNLDEVPGRVLDGELRYQWRGQSQHLVIGTELSRDLLANQKNFNSVPAAALGVVDVNINSPVTRRALFAQGEWQLDPAWQLSLGLRLDSASGQDGTRSPRLGVIWQAAPDWTVKLLAGRAYRSPNAYESQFAAMNYLSNPNLKAETIRSTEGVLEWRSFESSRWQFSLYQNQLDQLIQQVEIDGTGVFQFQNIGNICIHGAELGLEQTYASGVQWRASLSLSQASSSLGSSVDNSPGWIAKASGSTPLLGAAMVLAGELQWVGPRDYHWNATPYLVPTEVLANLTATFPHVLTKGWSGQLRISNLFNRSIAHPASAEILSPLVPQPGRQLNATLSYAF